MCHLLPLLYHGTVDMENYCQPLRELHLFAGAGGGILGSLLLGHRIIGAVEQDEYCCRVLEQRQRDGILEPFPIFQTDIRDFIRHGYAELYKGACDIICAGFPCQPFSVAGKRQGADDERNMWPATRDCIGAVQPGYIYLENSPNVIAAYGGTIFGELAALGYDCRWDVVGAMALSGGTIKSERAWIAGIHKTNSKGLEGAEREEFQREVWKSQPGRLSWWDSEPRVQRVADGVAHRVDRIRAIGNGQVPAVAAAAWQLLTESGDWG